MKRQSLTLAAVLGVLSVSAMASVHVSHRRKHPKQKISQKDGKSFRTRDIYFCNEIVTKDEFKSAKNRHALRDFVTDNTIHISTAKTRIWKLESHILTLYSGGDLPTNISIDGVNDLDLVKTPDPTKPNDVEDARQGLLGSPIDGFDGYYLGADTGIADEWGATAFVQKGLFSGTINGEGKLILRRGEEPSGDDSDTAIAATDSQYYCTFSESGVWKPQLR